MKGYHLLITVGILSILLFVCGCRSTQIPSSEAGNNATDYEAANNESADFQSESPNYSDEVEKINISQLAQAVLYLELYDDDNILVASGSGFLIGDGTTLVTNFHVIENAYSAFAYSADGKMKTELGKVLAYNQTYDIAILECDNDFGVLPLQLEESQPKQGDSIYAIGYPLGLANTVSDGIVSSVYTDSYGTDIIQITAPISHGSSGGALINQAGKVVGITSASYTSGQNLNIAIASKHISNLLSYPLQKEISLTELYQMLVHPRTVSQILDNPSKYDSTYQIIEGYVSSVFAYSAGDSEVIDYFIVSNYDDVLGNNYPTLVDIDLFIDKMRIENRRSLNYGSITFEIGYSGPSKIIAGQYITIRGRVNDSPNVKSIYIDDVSILE